MVTIIMYLILQLRLHMRRQNLVVCSLSSSSPYFIVVIVITNTILTAVIITSIMFVMNIITAVVIIFAIINSTGNIVVITIMVTSYIINIIMLIPTRSSHATWGYRANQTDMQDLDFLCLFCSAVSGVMQELRQQGRC